MVESIVQNIQTSIELSKCRHCGCMRESLEEIRDRLEGSEDPQFYPLFCAAGEAFARLEAVEYS